MPTQKKMRFSRFMPQCGLVASLGVGLLLASAQADAQCSVVVSHSGADFTGGQFFIQAGMVDGEAGAATYTLPANNFPIKISLIEAVFATFQATQQTTTVWEVFVYEGTPDTGSLVASYTSDDVILPHVRIGPGTAGANVQFSIDPTDPEQIYINNTGGSNSFTVGYRIVEHNDPPILPIFPPNRFTNAFMTTDANGLGQPTRNWLDAIDIGIGGAPGGWNRFSDLPTEYRPTGDWNIRCTYESLNPLVITDEPDPVNTTVGQPAIFQVVADGANPEYRWYKGNTALNNSTRIFGTTTDTLFIFPTIADDAGDYKVVVSNSCGTVTSIPAALSFGTPAVLAGNVILNDWIATRNGQPMQIDVRPVGSPSVLATVNATLNASGNYSVNLPASITPGTYDLACRGSHWVKRKRASVVISASGATGANFTLFNGDADASGEVDAADIDAVIADFGGSGMMTDLDGSTEVDAADIDIAIANFGQTDE